MNQDLLLEVWPIGEETTAFDLLDKVNESISGRKYRIEDIHRTIGTLLKWDQVEKSGSTESPFLRGNGIRATYTRIW